MKILLVLMLSMYPLHGSATNLLPAHSKRNVWRNVVQEKLPQHLQRILVGATTIATLLLASPSVAQEVGKWQEVDQPKHLNVFHIVLDFNGIPRKNVLVYVGEDKHQRALLLGLRLGMIILPIKNAEPLLDKSDAWLFDHEGLVLQQAKVEEVQAILRPDNLLARLYDLTLVAVRGLDNKAYQAAPLATSLPLQEPLYTVAYHHLQQGDWMQEFSEAKLYQRRCVANFFTPARWAALGNCNIGDKSKAARAPIYTAAGELIAFNLLNSEIVVIPPQALQYLQEALEVRAEQKLATTWANIKGVY